LIHTYLIPLSGRPLGEVDDDSVMGIHVRHHLGKAFIPWTLIALLPVACQHGILAPWPHWLLDRRIASRCCESAGTGDTRLRIGLWVVVALTGGGMSQGLRL
jgi:hypothetical protein